MTDNDYRLIERFFFQLGRLADSNAELVIETRRIADALQSCSPLINAIHDVADQVADHQE